MKNINGKGDRWRDTDYNRYFSNYDDIKWNKKKSKEKHKCDCHLHEKQVCDICQGPIGPDVQSS